MKRSMARNCEPSVSPTCLLALHSLPILLRYGLSRFCGKHSSTCVQGYCIPKRTKRRALAGGQSFARSCLAGPISSAHSAGVMRSGSKHSVHMRKDCLTCNAYPFPSRGAG